MLSSLLRLPLLYRHGKLSVPEVRNSVAQHFLNAFTRGFDNGTELGIACDTIACLLEISSENDCPVLEEAIAKALYSDQSRFQESALRIYSSLPLLLVKQGPTALEALMQSLHKRTAPTVQVAALDTTCSLISEYDSDSMSFSVVPLIQPMLEVSFFALYHRDVF